ncbi:MAG: hypothetical protein IIX80_03390, partial [Clostridia bacterium]|nr:hypothetical protein [Clostridia bacterium]
MSAFRRARRLRTVRERVTRHKTVTHRARALHSPAARRRPSKARSLGRAPQSAKHSPGRFLFAKLFLLGLHGQKKKRE